MGDRVARAGVRAAKWGASAAKWVPVPPGRALVSRIGAAAAIKLTRPSPPLHDPNHPTLSYPRLLPARPRRPPLHNQDPSAALTTCNSPRPLASGRISPGLFATSQRRSPPAMYPSLGAARARVGDAQALWPPASSGGPLGAPGITKARSDDAKGSPRAHQASHVLPSVPEECPCASRGTSSRNGPLRSIFDGFP